MTEEAVREVFFKNYSGGNLNEALRVSAEEISIAIIKKVLDRRNPILEIVETIVMSKSRITLFGRMTVGTNFAIPVSYLIYFDTIYKAMMEVVRYTRDNLETMDPWFRERFKKEHLESISTEMASVIEKTAKRPTNVRTFHSGELELYDEFFTSALIGIIGLERFQRYAKEYNRCVVVLRQCQTEYKVLNNQVGTKES